MQSVMLLDRAHDAICRTELQHPTFLQTPFITLQALLGLCCSSGTCCSPDNTSQGALGSSTHGIAGGSTSLLLLLAFRLTVAVSATGAKLVPVRGVAKWLMQLAAGAAAAAAAFAATVAHSAAPSTSSRE
jgi:hypothetical protein